MTRMPELVVPGSGVREQSRARYPDEEGYVTRDGVRVFYEVYGDGDPTIVLLPTWSLIHSRHWKLQIPLSRPSLPCDHVRRARQREVGPTARRGCLPRARVRRRRAGDHGPHRH